MKSTHGFRTTSYELPRSFWSILLCAALCTTAWSQDQPEQKPAQEKPAAEKTEAAPKPAPKKESAPAPKKPAPPTQPKATVESGVNADGSGRIIIEATGLIPESPLFYRAEASSRAMIGTTESKYEVTLKTRILQGEADVLSFELFGKGTITEVLLGGKSAEFAVRQVGEQRFLDLSIPDQKPNHEFTIRMKSPGYKLPETLSLLHLGPGDAAGFSNRIVAVPGKGLDLRLTPANAFLVQKPTEEKEDIHFHTSTGGKLQLELKAESITPDPVVLRDIALDGKVDLANGFISFSLKGEAEVNKKDVRIPALGGNVAVSALPEDAGYRLNLTGDAKNPGYEMVFPETGTWSISLDFVVELEREGEWYQVDLQVLNSAVTPLHLTGLNARAEFKDGMAVKPALADDKWQGYVPASGVSDFAWKMAREATEGKLFFTTSGQIETMAGAGLLRQSHQIEYQILQGELASLQLQLEGPAEVLKVTGQEILGWQVQENEEGGRVLDVQLSQPITDSRSLTVTTQTTLSEFPVEVEASRLTPIGAVRHAGYIRLSNQGAVRLEPTDLDGLTQLSPEQFTGKALNARQIFVYRFPSADHTYSIQADRIRPEVNVSQLTIYEFSETDRIIRSDMELDIREAPVREWDLRVPADYSVVSVTGNTVADYVVGTEVQANQRTLKVIFANDVAGRQLVSLHLEKNAVPEAGEWPLPPLEFPYAESVRGDIGVAGVAGFRISVGTVDLLAEKPLAYFPRSMENLQQAFRIRERGWTGTMQVAQLDESIQADAFHLYSLSERTAFASVLLNYFVTGAPVSEWRLAVPQEVENLSIDGKDVRTWRREGDEIIVSLHRPVIGPWTMLVTYEHKLSDAASSLLPGRVTPLDVRGERGFIHIVSPVQVRTEVTAASEELLKLDALELPAEFQLLTSAPPLATWQYTERPFNLAVDIEWFDPGETIAQIVEFAEVQTRVSPDGALVTDLQYYVKSRGSQVLRLKLPEDNRLWNVSVSGRAVTARQDGDTTLIPLPSGSDPNAPIPVMVRLGKASVSTESPVLELPVMEVPIVKTEWHVHGGVEDGIYVPSRGNFSPVQQVYPPMGYRWLAERGLGPFVTLTVLGGLGLFLGTFRGWMRLPALTLLAIATFGFFALAAYAFDDYQSHVDPLRFSIPALMAGEEVLVQIQRVNPFLAHLTLIGGILMGVGFVGSICSFFAMKSRRTLTITAFSFLFGIGILYHRNSSGIFLTIAGILLAIGSFWTCIQIWKGGRRRWKTWRAKMREKDTPPAPPEGATTTSLLLLGALSLGLLGLPEKSMAAEPTAIKAAESMTQSWTVENGVLSARGTLTLRGKAHDHFTFLESQATLTRFEGNGLRVKTLERKGRGNAYVITILESDGQPDDVLTRTAEFEYQMMITDPVDQLVIPTGVAVTHQLEIQYEKPGWTFSSEAAVRTIQDEKAEGVSKASMLLSPRAHASIQWKPLARDPSSEKTRFFVEGSHLYLPAPGVVDGKHDFQIRPAQGQVSELTIQVPEELTVSEVAGKPVTNWQFDADQRTLRLSIEPPQSSEFSVQVSTQKALDPLPTESSLKPLQITGAEGEVGLTALAFGPDAQPETITSDSLSQVNINDFKAGMLPSDQVTLHRVYRYSQEGGEIAMRVAPVAPEVRVTSREVLSLGDERLVLGVEFTVNITRTGLFQLSFPLPEGLEIESLSGGALSHWAESTSDDSSIITMHLNGKTLGSQQFSLSLTGPTPEAVDEWQTPHFMVREATRQTGELIVQPATGIRLRTVSRQNASEVDPRTVGAGQQTALAYRLLQQDWNLSLAIEKLDPWVTAEVLQELTLREGQTRTAYYIGFEVENASVRSIQVRLPISEEDEIKSLRASGASVSDVVRVTEDDNLWEIQFKRRVVGDVDVRIEYERRGNRGQDVERVEIATFPDLGQVSYYAAIRSGGRLQLEAPELPRGWQHADWNTIPESLRQSGDRTIPLLTLRAVSPEEPVLLQLQRHALADALRLRVSSGSLMTVISPLGDQLTAVDLNFEVIQRSSLTVGLPGGGDLFSIFVNGESITSVRQGDQWQFYILPGPDDRNANVRFIYALPGDELRTSQLSSPLLNVPLENIEWRVLPPAGYHLVDHAGDMELRREERSGAWNRQSYLQSTARFRDSEAMEATQNLQQANEYLKKGEQKKAIIALNNVANRYALDAASNEDARVQLENLKTQQAIVGLNTRRQRVSISNAGEIGAGSQLQQIEQGAADNFILNDGRTEFRPDEMSQLLQGNTTEDNTVLQRIAGKLISHQRAAEPAPQAITVTLPEEGNIYSFHRTVQVEENAPLSLTLWLASTERVSHWRFAAVVLLVLALCLMIVRPWQQKG